MRILIAEDDKTSGAILKGILESNGYEVVKTDNGADALKEMQKPDAPSLAIFDWMMPAMDGFEVLRSIRSQKSDQPPYIIMLTQKSDMRSVVDGLEAGANDYICKPFNKDELTARVNVGRRMVELQAELATNIKELRKAFDEIKVLKGIIPICTNCKNIRNDQGYWNKVEVYIGEHSDASFSHGLCPGCMQELYPGLESILEKNNQ